MVIHKLKIDPKYFEDVRLGTKPFEIRENDRNFHVGDKLLLCEYDRDKKEYTGNQLTATITYITDFAQMGGHVVLGLNDISEQISDNNQYVVKLGNFYLKKYKREPLGSGNEFTLEVTLKELNNAEFGDKKQMSEASKIVGGQLVKVNLVPVKNDDEEN